MVQSIAQASDRIPLDQRAQGFVLAPNYGVAAAVDVLGRPLGLPAGASGHNSYWLWGPPVSQPAFVIVVGGQRESRLREWFGELTRAGETSCRYCMTYENHQPIWIARRLRVPVDTLWLRLKLYE